MSETDAADLVPPREPEPTAGTGRRRIRWKAIVGLAGIAGLVVAAASTADDARGQTMPSAGALAGALVLQVVAMLCAGRAWVSLFPPEADRRALLSGLYTSQLTKYLPAGGFVQAASQVALSSRDAGVAAAALRLPVFSLCAVVGAAALGAPLALESDLPAWGRALALVGLLAPAALDRRLLRGLLGLLRRVVSRLPEADALPPQRAILVCFGFTLCNLLAYAGAFVLLVGDLDDVDPVTAGAAFCAGWCLGYLALPLPSGLGVREAVLVAALPGVATAAVLATSVAHRLAGFLAEAGLAGRAQAAEALAQRRRRSARHLAGPPLPSQSLSPTPPTTPPAPTRHEPHR